MTRFVLSILVAGFVGTAVLCGLASAGDPDKCTLATSGTSETAKACAKGGRKEAKKTMKRMVQDAKTKGEKFTCEQCHKDLDNYALTSNGKDDFKKLEAVLAKK